MGHSCLAVDGPALRERLLRTGDTDHSANMVAFAMAALQLLGEVIDAETADRAAGVPPG